MALAEAEAVRLILARIEDGTWRWIGSDVVDAEIAETPNAIRRSQVALLTRGMERTIVAEPTDFKRATNLRALGFQPLDALRL